MKTRVYINEITRQYTLIDASDDDNNNSIIIPPHWQVSERKALELDNDDYRYVAPSVVGFVR